MSIRVGTHVFAYCTFHELEGVVKGGSSMVTGRYTLLPGDPVDLDGKIEIQPDDENTIITINGCLWVVEEDAHTPP